MNPVRLAILSKKDPQPPENFEWYDGRPFEVAPPAMGVCCNCWSFIPPEDKEHLVPSHMYGIKRDVLKFVD